MDLLILYTHIHTHTHIERERALYSKAENHILF